MGFFEGVGLLWAHSPMPRTRYSALLWKAYSLIPSSLPFATPRLRVPTLLLSVHLLYLRPLQPFQVFNQSGPTFTTSRQVFISQFPGSVSPLAVRQFLSTVPSFLQLLLALSTRTPPPISAVSIIWGAGTPTKTPSLHVPYPCVLA